jgi:hypothetical protein
VTVDVPALSKNGSVPLYVPVNDFSIGAHDCSDGIRELRIDAIVDPWNKIAETNELNNTAKEQC